MLVTLCLIACSGDDTLSTKEKRLRVIEKEIVRLTEQIHLLRLKQLSIETDDEEYTEEKLSKRIAALLAEKRELQKKMNEQK